MQPEREFYALDRVTEGVAVLLSVDREQPQREVRLPLAELCAALPGDAARPADGTLFYRDDSGVWNMDETETRARQQAMRSRVQRLLARRSG